MGFFDVAYFCKIFKKHIGITPKQYSQNKKYSKEKAFIENQISLLTKNDEIQRKYQEEMLYRENTVSDDIIASSRMNLTKGYIEALRVGKDDGYENEFRYALALDERVKSYANRIWIDEEQLRRMTPEKLLESYQKGQHRLSERFVAELKNGRHVWIRVEVSIVERPETSEIIAFVYSRNITKEKR